MRVNETEQACILPELLSPVHTGDYSRRNRQL